MKQLKDFIKRYPEYKLEALELLMYGEDALDIYNYLNNRRLAELNDKILTEIGI